MENIQWLIANGGPAIKLRMMNEGLIEKDAYDVEKLIDELLQIEKVRTAFTYFDKFKEYKSIPLNTLYSFIHNCYEDCYEMFMPFLVNHGFKAGMPVFDEKVGYMREVYQYLMTLGGAYVGPIVMYMLEAGYYDDDMLDYMKRFLDKIYNTARQQCFDIYETDSSKIRYSKLPKEWKDKPILKDIHVNGELTVPTIYHVRYIIDIYKYVDDKEIKEKIDTVIKYILHPQYQKLRGDYGYGWFYNKAYYACSSGVSLPLYEGNNFGKTVFELMSNSPIALGTEWFRKCMDFLEQYKTERGTYIFPEDFYITLFYDQRIQAWFIAHIYQKMFCLR